MGRRRRHGQRSGDVAVMVAMDPATYPYLVCADDPLAFQATTVEAADLVHAQELSVEVVRGWREKARSEGRVFAPKGGVRVFLKSGSMQAVRR